MRRDYSIHEEAYRRRKSIGYAGWQSDSELAKTLQEVASDFRSPFSPVGGRAIELGCGAGDLTIWLAERGFEAHGIDISPTAIIWAKEKSERRNVVAEFVLGSVVELAEFSANSFDLAFDGHCLHCIIEDDRRQCLESVRRVLRETGVFYVRTMCFEAGVSKPNLSKQLRERFDATTGFVCSEDGTATRFVGEPSDILNEIVSAGFLLLDWRIDRAEGELDTMDDLIVWAGTASI